MASAPTGELFKSINGLFNQSRYSDFTITCGTRSWRVHKAIICSRSKYFERACCGEFKEAIQASIELKDDDPNMVNGMLRFLYSADYEDTAVEGRDDHHPLSFSVSMYAIADKYELESLAELALAKFSKHVLTDWNSPEFADAVHTVYATSFPSKSALRMIIMNTIGLHAKELLVEDQGKKIREVIAEVPELGLELCVGMTIDPVAKAVPEKKIPETWYACCNPSACGRLIVFNAKPVVGTSYNCNHCGAHCTGQALLSRRSVADTLLREMHAKGL